MSIALMRQNAPARPWQESKKGTGMSPDFDFEVFEIPVDNVHQDKLQLIVW